MFLDRVRTSLVRDLESPTAMAAFTTGRARQHALAAFDTPTDVVRFLNTQELGTAKQRSAVTAALIAEAQRRDASCWSTMLLLAFFPSLIRTRMSSRIVGQLGAADLDALALECFLETIDAFPLGTQGRHAVVNLMLGTRKLVRRHLVLEKERAELEQPVDEQELRRIASLAPTPEDLALAGESWLSIDRIANLLANVDIRGVRDRDEMIFLAETLVSDRPLIDLVRERHPDLAAVELIREYGRVRRHRNRLLGHLKRRFSQCFVSQRPSQSGSIPLREM